jgi:hypothetical protein
MSNVQLFLILSSNGHRQIKKFSEAIRSKYKSVQCNVIPDALTGPDLDTFKVVQEKS